MATTFPLRRGRAARILIAPVAPGAWAAEVGADALRVRMSWLGRAEVPLRLVDRITRFEWPWWGGLGVRLGRNLVAYVAASGTVAMVELSEPISVRAPLAWRTSRIAIGAEDVDGLIEAIAAARRAL